MVRWLSERFVIVMPPQLDVVFGRDADFGMRVDPVIAAAKFGAGLREDGLVDVGLVSVGCQGVDQRAPLSRSRR